MLLCSGCSIVQKEWLWIARMHRKYVRGPASEMLGATLVRHVLLVSTLSSIVVSWAASSNGDSFQLSDQDIERLAERLGHGFSMPSQRRGFSLGGSLFTWLLVAGALAGLVYWRSHFTLVRRLNRRQKGEALQALQDMDTETLRRLLGNVNLPSWVNFPDFERVNWVNMVAAQLWPCLAAYLAAQAVPRVDPLLEANRPAWMQSIKLLKLDLGEHPPQVQGVKVYRQEEQGSPDEVLLECDFMWAGQQDVEILVQPVPRLVSTWLIGVGKLISTLIRLKVSLKKLIVNGRLRVTLTPLLKEAPIVGAMQVSLVDMPDFSFDLDVLGGDVTLLPGLEAWLNNLIRSSVLRPYVLPDSYVVPLTDSELGIQPPRGILSVQLLEAADVPRMDLLSRSDPYCKLGVRASHMLTSQVIDNDLNPRWDERFKLLVHEPEHQVLRVELYDYDALDTDDRIGEARAEVKALRDQQEHDLWLDVDTADDPKGDSSRKNKNTVRDVAGKAAKKLRRHGRDRKPCRVHLKATYYEFKEEEVKAALEAHKRGADGAAVAREVEHRVQNKDAFNMLMGGVLYVRARKATALVRKPWYKGGGFVKASATLCVRVAGTTKKSATVQGNDPAWGEALEFILGADQVQDADQKTIDVEVWDFRAAKSFRGEAQVNLGEVLRQGRVRNTHRLKGVDHGELELDVKWLKVLDIQPRR